MEKREELKKYLNRQIQVTATVGRASKGNRAKFIELKNIRLYTGLFLTDHVWVLNTHYFTYNRIQEGDEVKLEAVVYLYTKDSGDKDFGLSIKKIEKTYDSERRISA